MVANTLRYQVPGEDWFAAYLQNIAESMNGSGDAISDNKSSDWLWTTLSDTIEFIFEIHAIERIDVQDDRDEQVSDGALPFPVLFHYRRWKANFAHAELKLESMINGHMGYNEDDFSASFSIENKKIAFRCYIFTSNILTVEFIGVEETLKEKICAYLSERFILQP